MSSVQTPRLGPAIGIAPRPEEWDGTIPDDERLLQDPHGWARCFARDYAVWDRREGVKWVLRFPLCEPLLKHPDMRQFGAEVMHLYGVTEGPLYDWWTTIMLTANGERHKRQRRTMQRTFSFPLIAKMRPEINTIIKNLVDQIPERGEWDFDELIASQIPVRTICAILGVPESDIDKMHDWVDILAHAFGTLGLADLDTLNDACTNLNGYASELIADRLKTPRDDFLSDLINTVKETQDIADDELPAQIIGLLFAGSDTTRTALSVAASLLLLHRDQWDLLVRDRSHMKSCIEETLRYEPTVAALPRLATKDMTVEGETIPEGTVTVMNIAAAQRDPARYKNPDQFDITRTDVARGTIGFGGGPHRCMGEALARAEIEETLTQLADRMPHMEISGNLPTFESVATGIRRLEGLKITV